MANRMMILMVASIIKGSISLAAFKEGFGLL